MIGPHGEWLEVHPDWRLWDKPLADFLADRFRGETVVDLGCGLGHYLAVWRSAGIDCRGYDGSPIVVDSKGLGIKCVDLAEPADIEPADWCVSLEVGEHIPAEFSAAYLDNVARAAWSGVVLSWAVPNQPGHGHVNCRPNLWVVEQMQARGWRHEARLSAALRGVATLWYFRNTLMAFSRLP